MISRLFEIGASGLRSSWPSVARNSSLRRSAERKACSFFSRSVRWPRIWYWRERARIAVCAALRSVVTRVGRSSSVTLPSVRHASADSGESAPGRVRIRIGRSDHGGCRVSHVDERRFVRRGQVLFGDQHRGGAVVERVDERVEGGERRGLDPGAVEQIAS